MTIRYVDKAPKDIAYYPEAGSLASRMDPDDVEQVAQIFQTPIVGSYSWDYVSCDHKIRRLYELGKKLNWNATEHLDWSQTFPKTEDPVVEALNPFVGFPAWEALSPERQLEFSWHSYAWTLSQFMHGEQGALLVSSQLVSCAPTFDGKLYSASQTFDEARHVEVFSRYMQEKVGLMYPINPHLKSLLDKVLTDQRWDLKFVGMQIIIEGLALAAFQTLRLASMDPLFRELLEYVIRDEARHVAFGVTYMEQFVRSLSEQEKEERAHFAYEACVVMRERLVASHVHAHFGFDVEAARIHQLESGIAKQFNDLLFMRVIPNLKRVGLLTEKVRPLYDELGLLVHENLVHDGEIDWAAMEEDVIPRGAEAAG